MLCTEVDVIALCVDLHTRRTDDCLVICVYSRVRIREAVEGY